MAHVIGLISLTATAGVINSITNVSSSVFSLLSYIQLTKNANTSELCVFLEKSDIDTTLKLLHSIVTELNTNQTVQFNAPILLALENINDSIGRIEEELVNIRQKIEYNNSLYVLTNIRGYDCTVNLKNMEIGVAILEKRSKNLFHTIRLFA
jgi:hypothetical protein